MAPEKEQVLQPWCKQQVHKSELLCAMTVHSDPHPEEPVALCSTTTAMLHAAVAPARGFFEACARRGSAGRFGAGRIRPPGLFSAPAGRPAGKSQPA